MSLPRTTAKKRAKRKAGKATKRQTSQKRACLTMGRILMVTEKMARRLRRAAKYMQGFGVAVSQIDATTIENT